VCSLVYGGLYSRCALWCTVGVRQCTVGVRCRTVSVSAPVNVRFILLGVVGWSPVGIAWPYWSRASASTNTMPHDGPSATASGVAGHTLAGNRASHVYVLG